VILTWTRRASVDRAGIIDRIGIDNPAAAHALDDRFSQKSRLLIDHPRLGRPGRVPGTRELVTHPSYILIYDVTRTTVRILRVMHAARQWPAPRG
jgi:addiction module RelE/StbE family toxin